MILSIQEAIWRLAISTGSTPFTVQGISLINTSQKIVSKFSAEDYTHGIAFYIWDDYTLEEYKDYVENSQEYLLIADLSDREQFLQQQVEKHKEPKNFRQWQYNQLYVALGIALNELKTKGLKYQEVEPHYIDLFKPLVKISRSTLVDIILFRQ